MKHRLKKRKRLPINNFSSVGPTIFKLDRKCDHDKYMNPINFNIGTLKDKVTMTLRS